MITEKVYKGIVNFMIPRVGVAVLGFGHIRDSKKMLNFIKIFYSPPRHTTDFCNWAMMSKNLMTSKVCDQG